MGHDGHERESEVKPWSGVPYSHYRREGKVGYEECWVKSESLCRAAHQGHSRGREPESGWGTSVLESSSVCFCNILD